MSNFGVSNRVTFRLYLIKNLNNYLNRVHQLLVVTVTKSSDNFILYLNSFVPSFISIVETSIISLEQFQADAGSGEAAFFVRGPNQSNSTYTKDNKSLLLNDE